MIEIYLLIETYLLIKINLGTFHAKCLFDVLHLDLDFFVELIFCRKNDFRNSIVSLLNLGGGESDAF